MNALPLQFLLLTFSGWVNRHQCDVIDYLQEENRILREHLSHKRLLFTDTQRRRLAAKAKRVGRQGLEQLQTLVTPETLLRWYRKLIAKKYDGTLARRVGRPRTAVEIEPLILRMARENSSWGYTRIRGALYNLGHEIGRNTIKRILLDNGLDPAPYRHKGMSWETFLKAHWGAIAATDFFTVEVLTRSGLVRYLVLFVIKLDSRRIESAGIAPDPNGAWMMQVARNLTDVEDGALIGSKYLVHDRDPLFITGFINIIGAVGVRSVRLPPRSPNLNAYAERFVRTIKSECLAHLVPLGERHLRCAVTEFTEHYHFERNHQGINNRLIEPTRNDRADGDIVGCRERLGGILKYYHRIAA
jgi:putative transposase